jgi:hypothetical protein
MHSRLPRTLKQKPCATNQSYGGKTDTKRDRRSKRVTFAHAARHCSGPTFCGSAQTKTATNLIIANLSDQSE